MENEDKPTCPTCKAVLDCVTPVTGNEAPKEVEYSICFNCGEFLVFTEPPFVRRMEFSEEVNMDDKFLDAMKRMRYRVVQKKAYKDFVKNYNEFGL